MATYKYNQLVNQNNSDAFDKIYEPGQRPKWSGIYRCEGCGKEISHTENQELPPQNHHQHSVNQGKIRWRMAVYAKTA